MSRPPPPCGDWNCGRSMAIDDVTLTFGKGELDDYGFWSEPCRPCADEYHARTGKPSWPGHEYRRGQKEPSDG